MPLRRLLPLAVLALALVPAAPAAADQAVAEIGPPGARRGLRRLGGVVALRRAHRPLHAHAGDPGQPAAKTPLPAPSARSTSRWAPTPTATSSPSTSAAARAAATSAATTPPAAPSKLSTVSSPSYDEATPAIWRSNVVFTRRVNGCDVPYVKNLSSSASSRRLLKSKCLQTDPGPRLDPRQPHRHQLGRHRAAPTATARASRPPSCASTRAAPAARRSSSSRASARSPTTSARWPRTTASPTPCASGSTRPTRSCASRGRAASPRRCGPSARSPTAFAKPSANASLYVESQGGEETVVRRLHRRPVPPRARARDPVRRRAAHADPAAHGRLPGPAAARPAAALQRARSPSRWWPATTW